MSEKVNIVNTATENGNINVFSERLQKARKKAGFTSQEALADAIGVNRVTINYYEQGTRKPDIEIFIKIANALNVSCDYLLGYSNSKKRTHHETKEITRLSDKAIETLEIEAIETNKKTEAINGFNEMCKMGHYTLNYLLENELDYQFFNDFGNFIFFKEKNKKVLDLNQPITNDDFKYAMTIKEWETSFKIRLDEKILNIKNDIEKKAENKSTHNKNKE